MVREATHDCLPQPVFFSRKQVMKNPTFYLGVRHETSRIGHNFLILYSLAIAK